MISRTKQDWSIGNVVKVGFLSLTVVAAVATPGDHAPDAYILKNKTGTQLYKFVPHNGVEKIDVTEACALISTAKLHAEREAARAIAKAEAASKITLGLAAVFVGMTEQDGDQMATYTNFHM